MVAIGAAATTSRGPGKLCDGDYDPVDAALLLARIDFAAGTRWIVPGLLERIAPRDEATLVETALARGLVVEPRADPLRAALERFQRGEVSFVRSPGLLDRLWAAVDDPLRPAGLIEWFESTIPLEESSSRPSRAEPQPSLLPTSRPTPTWPEIEPAVAEPEQVPCVTEPCSLMTPLTEAQVLSRVLAAIDHNTVSTIIDALEVPRRKRGEIRTWVEQARPPLAAVVSRLRGRQLRAACGAVGIPVLPDDEVLARNLLLRRVYC